MKRSHVIELATAAAVAAMVTSPAAAATSPVIGTWRYKSFERKYVEGTPAGAPAPNPYGPDGRGYLVFDQTGHYMMGIVGQRGAFAETNRKDGTSQEFASVVLATELIFGTYTADDAKHTLNIHIERAMFPNWDDSDRVWSFEIDGDTLRQIYPITPSAAGPYLPSAVWTRVR